MKRFCGMNGQNKAESKEEAMARRLVTFMGLIGPVTLVGLVLWIVHWDASINARTAQTNYFPSHYVNAASVLEDHIQAF
jgi:hypothetical protein